MMPKAIRVSMARNNFGFWKRLPSWARVQNSIGDSRPAASKATLTRFITKSTEAQRMTNQPKRTRPVPDAQHSKKELEDAKGNTDGYCLKFWCLKETRFHLL